MCLPAAEARSWARLSRHQTTSSASMERSTPVARASLVHSSTTFKNLSILSSLAWSNWKSQAHTTLGRIGQKGPTGRPIPRRGFLRFQ